MKRLIIIAALIGAVIVMFQLAYPRVTIRYRLALEADVNGKPEFGSGVIEVTYRAVPRLLGASSSTTTEVRGDATSMVVGPSVVLALLAQPNAPENLIPILFGVPRDDFSRIRGLSGTHNLPPELLPPLVRLDDPRNPSTAKLVGPSSLSPGASLRSASIEIVGAGYWPLTVFGVSGVPVTRGIENILPWVTSESGRLAFWKTIYSSGFRSNGNIEIKTLLTRG